MFLSMFKFYTDLEIPVVGRIIQTDNGRWIDRAPPCNGRTHVNWHIEGHRKYQRQTLMSSGVSLFCGSISIIACFRVFTSISTMLLLMLLLLVI